MIIPTKEKETSGKVIIEEQRKWLLCFTLFMRMMGGWFKPQISDSVIWSSPNFWFSFHVKTLIRNHFHQFSKMLTFLVTLFQIQKENTCLNSKCRFFYIGNPPPPVLLSSAAPGRWSLLISTGRTPITHDMVYVLL